MHRIPKAPAVRPVRAVLATLGLLATATFATAQGPKPAVAVLDVRADDAALPGAEVRFHPEPPAPLTLLEEWSELLPAAAVQRTVADARGRVRLELGSPDSADRRGAVEIRHPPGADARQGALLFHPEAYQRVQCTALAEVRLPRRCEVHLLAIAGDGRAFSLGARREVERLRLPEGTYRLLMLAEDFAAESGAIRLRSGQQLTLPPPGTAPRRLAAAGPADLRMRHWPRVALTPRDGGIALPGGRYPLRLLAVDTHVGIDGGRCRSPRELWASAEVTELPPAPAPKALHPVQVRDPDDRPVPGARVLTAHQGLRLELDSVAVTDREGRAIYASTGDATTELLVVAPGFVPVARRLDGRPPGSIRLERGRPLELTVFDPRGTPAAAVQVEILRPDQPLLHAVSRTDARGTLSRSDLAPGPLAVRLRDPRFLAEEHPVQIEAEGLNRRSVRARHGVQISGRVELPGGGIAGGAVVVLRDTTGRTDFSRTAVADAQGAFAFSGLPEDFQLRLSASLQTPAGPFISRHLSLTHEPDGEPPGPVLLTLKSEDPGFPGRR